MKKNGEQETEEVKEQCDEQLDVLLGFSKQCATKLEKYLNNISGCIDLLKYKAKTKEQFELLAIIEQNTYDASVLSKQLMLFSKNINFQKTKLDMHLVILDTLDILTPLVKRKIVNAYRLNALMSLVFANRSVIQQAFTFLIINSIESISAGGQIVIETSNLQIDNKPTSAIADLPAGEYLKISILAQCPEARDNLEQNASTIDVPAEDITDDTCIELTISKNIIKRHGGAIAFLQNERHEKTVEILLPLTSSSVQISTDLKNDKCQKNKGTLLIADDEEMVLNVLIRMATRLGYDTLKARNGKEALQLYKDNKDKIDLVILDVLMPLMDGIKCFREIKAIDSNAKIIIATGFSHEHDLDQLWDEGVSFIMEKPFKLVTLFNVLKKVLPNG